MKKESHRLSLTTLSFVLLLLIQCCAAEQFDIRNVETGSLIPSQGYADQPYVVVAPNGDWVCVLTTGVGHEGAEGQSVYATVSTDRGLSWSSLIAIEPPGERSASWAVPLLTKFGRIYAFYTFNGDAVHLGRDDTHGWYCYRYSDDYGRTWSRQRFRLPVRITACDTLEVDGQGVQMFWGICKPIVVDDTVYFSFTKIGQYFLKDSEGWLFKSDNILTESDVDLLQWAMLPDGMHGIRHPEFGSVQEEHNMAALSNGDLVCVYRTTLGFPALSYSGDGGHTWSLPQAMCYSPGGHVIRNPRACPKIWRCSNGKFLFWYHNHGGKDFMGRNPVWLSGGIEAEGVIHWSQPEILLYHDTVNKRMSYPCLIEDEGQYYVTETEKENARVHPIDPDLLNGLWDQFANGTVAQEGLLLDLDEAAILAVQETGVAMPRLPALTDRLGFTIEMWYKSGNLLAPEVILDSRQEQQGIVVSITPEKSMTVEFSDGTQRGKWDIDQGLIQPDTLHHIVFIVDAGPHLITALVDGRLCDGTTHVRQYGWGRFAPGLADVSGGPILKLMSEIDTTRGRFPGQVVAGQLKHLRIYQRYLRTSEAIGNYRAGY